MLSNLASYIFGETSEESAVAPPTAGALNPSSVKEEDGWVVVGGEANNADLGSLSEHHRLPSVSDGTSPSAAPSEAGSVPAPPAATATRSSRRLATPFSHSDAATLSQMKAVRSAQYAAQKKSAATSTAKMLERRNKAVMSSSCRKQANKHNFAVKSSGINKQLKQC